MAIGAEIYPETYREAALERLTDVKVLRDKGQYAAAIYSAGVAVECSFRAYAARNGKPFDKRHDLRAWAKTSGFVGALVEDDFQGFSESLSTVTALWTNTHRYRSASAMLAFLRRAELDRGIKGDVVKERSRQIQIAASRLAIFGERRWKNSGNA